MGDAIAQDGAPDDDTRAPSGGTERALTVEHTLAAAGIGPDHPSLYPGDPRPR